MYRHILVPLENTPTDEAILRHVQPLAKAVGARVTLIHVADGFVARNQELLNLEDSDEIREDRAYLRRRHEELTASGLDVSIILVGGEPADEILAAAAAQQCDLIAMATHGHRFVGDVILGSVAHAIRHRTDIPVLMVRAPQAR